MKDEGHILEALNAEIALRTQYGVRREVAPARGYILNWSNSAREWWLFQPAILKGHEVRLDANQIFAPYPQNKLLAILPELEELPLYRYSFEAVWVRGTEEAVGETRA